MNILCWSNMSDDAIAELAEAIEIGSPGDVERVLDEYGEQVGPWLNAPQWQSMPALVFAAAAGAPPPVADVLLRCGADINGRSQAGCGVLHLVWWDADLAAAYRDRGAAVDVHAAAGLGDMGILEAAAPSVLNARGPNGMVPLHSATDLTVADFLLSRGAALDIPDQVHLGTPTQWLVRRRPHVAAYLLDRGAEPDPFVLACLGWASLMDLVALSPDLVTARSSEEAPGGHVHLHTVGKSMTLLHVASRFGHRDVVRQLLQAGLDVDARAGAGETALHFAAYEGHLGIVDALLGWGASTVIRDTHFNGTAQDWAENADHTFIAECIRGATSRTRR